MAAERSSGLIKRLSPMRLPSVSDLCPASKTALRAMENAYMHAPASVDSEIACWLQTDPANTGNHGCLDVATLVHELSDCAMERQRSSTYDQRGMLERKIFAQSPISARALVGQGLDGFKEALCALSGVTGGATVLRQHMVNNGVDLAQCKVIYPDFLLINSQLANIHCFLLEHIATQPAFAAVVAYASISNLHPFADGNGRLARMLYNLVIRSAFPSAFHLPIYEVSALSRMGLVIRLRQAHYHGAWLPLISLFSTVVCQFADGVTNQTATTAH